MDKAQAKALIVETFTQAFDKARFYHFIRNLLNRIDDSKAARMEVPDAFKEHVRSCKRLGTYRTPDGELADVLVVNTTEPWKLERTRTALRDFVAHKLKRDDSYKEAGLIAFVSPDARSWRFSYVRMEYETKRDAKTGKIAIDEKVTPARRFSYLVGEGESCHTAQSRFIELLTKTDSDPLLSDIEKAFSVETVTKEFFRHYAGIFEQMEESLRMLMRHDSQVATEFDTKKISTVDFAKKLMGQIVFLYFLQKKGWLGVQKGKDWGTGPRDFLRQLVEGKICTYDNFFNEVLEPLFYDTLATDRGHEAWCETFGCRIPFLNGGLFEPLGDYDWRRTEIVIPNTLFTNDERINAVDVGTGMLDVLDRYNFTVNEAEPLEKEVAIDPEMLGKVFENLIEENRRKGLGSYYTPREIVHYMCQEVLINYLDSAINSSSDQAAATKRMHMNLVAEDQPQQLGMILSARQPVVPRADLETFIRLGDQISHYEGVEIEYGIKMPRSITANARLIDRKLSSITICDPAVGSGAFPVGMMNEIVRARSALTNYFNDVQDRTPYHFKRHAIQNSLYGVDIDPGAVEIAKLRLWLSLVVDEEEIKQIKPLPNLFYKIVVGNSLLGVEKNLFNQQLFERLEELKPRYFNEPDKDAKDDYKRQIEEIIHELTNGKQSFDFEIYFSEVFQKTGGFDLVIGNPPYILLQSLHLDSKSYTNLVSRYFVAQYKVDTYHLFTERGVNLLADKGVLAFITPNTFLQNKHTNKLRELLVTKTRLRAIVLFHVRVFEDPSVDNVVFICQRSPSLQFETSRAINIFEIRSNCFTDEVKSFRSYLQNNIEPPDFIFAFNASEDETALLKKIENGCRKLGEICGTYFGIQTFDRKKYVSTSRHSTTWRPVIDGGNVFRFRLEPPREYVNYRPENVKSGGDGRVYKRERIVVRQIGKYPEGTLCSRGLLTLNTIYNIFLKGEGVNLKFLLAIINSKLIRFYWLKRFYDNKELFPKIKKQPLELIPIKETSIKKQETIAGLVEQIIEAKAKDPNANVTAWESKINQIVFALYGLTTDEIQLIEREDE